MPQLLLHSSQSLLVITLLVSLTYTLSVQVVTSSAVLVLLVIMTILISVMILYSFTLQWYFIPKLILSKQKPAPGGGRPPRRPRHNSRGLHTAVPNRLGYLFHISQIVYAATLAKAIFSGKRGIEATSLASAALESSLKVMEEGMLLSAPCFIGSMSASGKFLPGRPTVGISGVYMHVLKSNPLRFYIGSSVNLGRRMQIYRELCRGMSKSTFHTPAELEFIASGDPALWDTVILGFYPPVVTLVMEQFFFFTLKPTMNTSQIVNASNMKDSTYVGNCTHALSVIQSLLSFYSTSFETATLNNLSKSLQSMLDAFKINPNLSNLGKPVYVYSVTTNELLYVLNSLNSAMGEFEASFTSIMNHIRNKYIFRGNSVLSFTLLEQSEVLTFQPLVTFFQTGVTIVVEAYNAATGELIDVYKSISAFRKAYGVHNTDLESALLQGELFQGMTLIGIPQISHVIFRYDAVTGQEILPAFKIKSNARLTLKVHYDKVVAALDNNIAIKGEYLTTKRRP